MILDDLITTQPIALAAPDTRPVAPSGYRGGRRRPVSTARLLAAALTASGWAAAVVLATAYHAHTISGWFRAVPGLILTAAGL